MGARAVHARATSGACTGALAAAAYQLASQAQRHQSAFLHEQLMARAALHRRFLAHNLPPALRSNPLALGPDLATSIDTWIRLRRKQGLSADMALDVPTPRDGPDRQCRVSAGANSWQARVRARTQNSRTPRRVWPNFGARAAPNCLPLSVRMPERPSR